MGRKCIEVKSLYGLTTYELNKIAKNSGSAYSSEVAKAVIMRYKGVHPQIIADTLSKCRATVISYINDWNTKGIASIADHRGGNNPSQLTDEMVENIRDTVANKSPHDLGYEQNRWSCDLISRYIEEKYGRKYSKAWVSLLLKSLGFTYKRGVFHSSLADVLLQESFKKNGLPVGFY